MILINSYEKINKFLHAVEQIPGEIWLVYGNRTVNARSVMSLYTLPLSSPLPLHMTNMEYLDRLTPFLYHESL